MTLLTEKERRRVINSVELGGLSFNEAAEDIISQRAFLLQRPIAQEIAALFGRRLYPIDREVKL